MDQIDLIKNNDNTVTIKTATDQITLSRAQFFALLGKVPITWFRNT